MAKVPQLSHGRIVRAFEKAGFKVIRQANTYLCTPCTTDETSSLFPSEPSKHVHLHGLIKDAGLGIEEFLKLL